MANIVDISEIKRINQVGNSYQRKSAIPLDYYSLFNSKTSAETYAKENPFAYVGQYFAVVENDTTTLYTIENESGSLKKVGFEVSYDEDSATLKLF